MEVILLEKIANLGAFGEKVAVKAGYGRNYLLPQGKAVAATAEKIAEFESRRAELEQKAKAELTAAQTRADKINALGTVTIGQKAGDEGKLFGSVGTPDIAEAVTAAGVEVKKSEVKLPEGLLRQLGEYEIQLQLHSDVMITINVAIVAED